MSKRDKRKKRKAEKIAKAKARLCPRCQGMRGPALCPGTAQCFECFMVIDGPAKCIGCFAEFESLEGRRDRECPLLRPKK